MLWLKLPVIHVKKGHWVQPLGAGGIAFLLSGHFLKNTKEEWPEIIGLGHSLLIFLILAPFWLSGTGQIWGFQAFFLFINKV